MSKFVPIEGSAGAADGSRKYVFNVNRLVLLSNDSATYDMLVNFDRSVGEAGTFTLKAGEYISGEDIPIREIYLQGIGGAAEFRAWGVG